MRTLVAGQAAFTFVVLLAASLLLASLDRLLRLPIGFDPQDVVVLRARAHPERPPDVWSLTADRLRAYPGVKNVALAEWPLLTNSRLCDLRGRVSRSLRRRLVYQRM